VNQVPEVSDEHDVAPVSASDDIVAVTVPADGLWLGVLRTATAGLAARLRLSPNHIEDLRIAVDEACVMLLKVTSRRDDLHCRFEFGAEQLTIAVSTTVVDDAQLPSMSSFEWQVLSGLATRAEFEHLGEMATIRLIRTYD
jgi:serine/threonine-protein kinase RsbW